MTGRVLPSAHDQPPRRGAAVRVAPPAEGVRLPWSAVPSRLRAAVEEALGARIVEAVTQTGGFSPAAAARLRLVDGRRAFAKAVGPEPNPDSAGLYRAEAAIAAALPAQAPAPRLLAAFDEDGWVVLVFEDVDGHMPAMPWHADELARSLDALTTLADALTPAPVDLPELPTAGDRIEQAINGWRALAAGEWAGGLDPWAERHLDRLAELEGASAAAAAGDTLVHGDVRADNLLLTPDRVMVVDWPWACIGAAWFDLLAMLPSVRMQGGPPPEGIFAAHPVGRAAEPAAVTAVLAAITGFFVRQSLLPAPPGLPTVRAFQRAQGEVALEWLRQRTGW